MMRCHTDIHFTIQAPMQDHPHKVGRVKPGCYVLLQVIGQELPPPEFTVSDSLCRVCALQPYYQQISAQSLSMCPLPKSIVQTAMQHVSEHFPSYRWIFNDACASCLWAYIHADSFRFIIFSIANEISVFRLFLHCMVMPVQSSYTVITILALATDMMS